MKYCLNFCNAGILHYNSPITQLLYPNQSILLNVNISDNQYFYVNINLAWYHNGTKISSNNRINITNNGTSLIITDTIDSDAGKYEVRIDSMQFSYENAAQCDKNLLPVLENLALHAPITFLLQQTVLPMYNPEDIFIQYTIPVYQGRYQQSITIYNNLMFNASAVLSYENSNSGTWKDGRYLSSDEYNRTLTFLDDMVISSIDISYNNSEEIIGEYVHFESFDIRSVNPNICPGYLSYFYSIFYFLFIGDVPFLYNYWAIKSQCK